MITALETHSGGVDIFLIILLSSFGGYDKVPPVMVAKVLLCEFRSVLCDTSLNLWVGERSGTGVPWLERGYRVEVVFFTYFDLVCVKKASWALLAI